MRRFCKIFLALLAMSAILASCTDEGKGQMKRLIRSVYKPHKLITQVHTVEGLDLSHHNIVYNWDSVSTSFIFLKATEGSDLVDHKFKEYSRMARARGIKVGAYHFLSTASPAAAQFNNFKRTVKKSDIDLIPVLDIEKQTPGHKLSKEDLQKHILEWSSLCEEHYGCKPIIYTGIDFYRKNLDKAVAGHMLWFGNIDCPISYISSVPWDIWQYTVKPSPGIKGNTDHNVLNEKHKLEDIQINKSKQK